MNIVFGRISHFILKKHDLSHIIKVEVLLYILADGWGKLFQCIVEEFDGVISRSARTVLDLVAAAGAGC